MKKGFETEQEAFWAGKFGNKYIDRNRGKVIIARNIVLFSKVLSHTQSISSVIEFGSNIGLNLMAIKQILPNAELSAIEINEKAVKELKKCGGVKVYHQSIFDFVPDYKRDFVLSKGVLIHINPDKLNDIYELLYETARQYICIAEYYNPTPVTVPYRGYSEKLFKRDFAGEIIEKYVNLRLVDYGFVYHKDKNYPQDDLTWFLLEKT